MADIVYKNKINRIRTFALSLIFIGMLIMYGGIMLRKIEWLMLILFLIGMLAILFSCVVYLWIGMLSTRAIPVNCPNCNKPTKMLGRVDACMHCRQPLTMDPSLDGKDFDEKYNSKKYKKEEKNHAAK